MSDDMQAWMAKHHPTEHHEHLRRSVGEWNVAGKFWMAPDQPPMETEGASTISPILDGRFVRHEYSSSFAGAPYAGLGIDGYDNNKEAYVSLWIDSMSTGFCLLEGRREGNVTTTYGEMPGFDGGTRKVKGVATHGDDGMTYAMYEHDGEGWRQTMELTYTRKS